MSEGAAEALRALSREELLNGIDAALALFEERSLDSCARALARDTGLAQGMIALGLKRVVAAHRRPHVDAWLTRAQEEAGASKPQRQRSLLYVLPGNVPGLVIPAAIESLLARCPAVFKASRGDRRVPGAWVECLGEAAPVLRAAVDWTYWRGGDLDAEAPFLGQADRVVASGDRATIDALRQRSAVPVTAHGPKWSLGAVGSGWTRASGEWWERAVRECVIWEQQGCLSPVALFVEGSLEAFSRRWGEAMASWDRLWPAARPVEQSLARCSFRTYCEMHPETSILNPESAVCWSRELLPLIPRGRGLAVYPLELLPSALEVYGGHVQALGTAFDPDLTQTGVNEFPLESMQDPPAGWRADGRSVLAELLAP